MVLFPCRTERENCVNLLSPKSAPAIAFGLLWAACTFAQTYPTHVPYKGGAAAVLDLMGGRLTYTFDALALQVPHVSPDRFKTFRMD